MNFDVLFEGKESTIARDLKLNLKRLMTESALSEEERVLSLIALSSAAGISSLEESAIEQGKLLGLQDSQVLEAKEAPAIMGMLNTYYKFRTYLEEKKEDYAQAKLRMTALAQPALGKIRFEMLAFALSVYNGCPSCIRSHEAVLRQHEVSVEQIHDLARMASVLKGVQELLQVS